MDEKNVKYLPSEKEIREACARIREKWTDVDFCSRRVDKVCQWSIPELAATGSLSQTHLADS